MGWLGYRMVNPASNPVVPTQALQASSLRPPGLPAIPRLPEAAAPDAGPSKRIGETVLSHGALAGIPTPAATTATLACLSRGSQEIAAPADPSNFGDRQPINWKGEAVLHTPQLIVLHETVVDEKTALALFQRHQSDDGQQASYHMLIGREGQRIRVVDDDKRAFGAGDSAFQRQAVQLRQAIPASVNNFALHVSLVSPPNGADGEAHTHSGYTPAQYESLARQIALWQSRYGIPSSQVTTHQEVDLSGTRHDPRSFDWSALGRNLRAQLRACSGTAPLAKTYSPATQPPRP
jgi:hypothetical protein